MNKPKATPSEVLVHAGKIRSVRDKYEMLCFIYDNNITYDRGLATVGMIGKELGWYNEKVYREARRLSEFDVLQVAPQGSYVPPRRHPVQLLFGFDRKITPLLARGDSERDAYILDALAADTNIHNAIYTTALVGAQGEINTTALSKIQGISIPTAQAKLQKLFNQGVLQKHETGAGRSVNWTLADRRPEPAKRAGKIKTNVHPLMTRAWV